MTSSKRQASAHECFAQALALHRAGRLPEAIKGYEKALALDRRMARAHNNRGIALSQLDRTREALASFSSAIKLSPRLVDALVNQGIALGQLGQFADAIASFDRALELQPQNSLARQYREAAAASLCDALAQDGSNEDPLAIGLSCAASGDLEGAVEAFGRAAMTDPHAAAPRGNLGTALQDLGRAEEALAAFDAAIALDAGLAQFHFGRGRALSSLGHPGDAIASYDRAIALGADHMWVHFARGDALAGVQRYREALASYEHTLALQPDLVAALYACGLMHWYLGDAVRTVRAAEAAIDADPLHNAAHNLAGMALQKLGRSAEALASFDRALAIAPADASAHQNRAQLLQDLGRDEEAIRAYEQALAHDPSLVFVTGKLSYLRLRLSDWTDHAERTAALAEGLAKGREAVIPFTILPLFDDPALQRAAAADYLARQIPQCAPPPDPYRRRERIRIGYISGDFHNHATMHLIADLLAEHDRSRVEIVGISYGPARADDPWRARAVAACDKFFDVVDRSDHEIAMLAHELEIDIAIDLKGITGHTRHGIFAARAAPVQVNWLGYPGTMPIPAIDYLIADPILIDAGERAHYAEKIIYLPDSYQPNCRVEPQESPLRERPTRLSVGLPEDGFVFASINQNYKITPEVFTLWMRLLRQVEGSVLWIWAGGASARSNLQREAQQRGIAGERLIFADLLPRDRHLARLSLADLFFDTYPCGAHTTASDALRAGVPMLTCPGRSFASRVGASLLGALRMSELVCESFDDFTETALALAREPERLRALRARLGTNRSTAPLFDPARFARQLEHAYQSIYERSQSSLPPQDVVVPTPRYHPPPAG